MAENEKDYTPPPPDAGDQQQPVQDASDRAAAKISQENQPDLRKQSDSETWKPGSSTTREQTNLNAIKEPDPTSPDNPYAGKVNAGKQCPLVERRNKELAAAMGRPPGGGEGEMSSPPGAKPATPDKGDKGGDKGDKAAKPGDKGKDATDRTYTDGETKAMDAYAKTLVRAGESPEKARELAKQTMDRLQDNKDKIEGTPEQQMKRLDKASQEILDRTGCKGDKRGDGKEDPLSEQNRKDMVRDLAHRSADPDKFANQGHHMTCALQSMHKQNLETNPAREAERMRDVVNAGKATITEKGGKTREVTVDPKSYAPDGESARPFSVGVHGDGGARGMAGHVSDSLYGQMAADLRSEREGKPQGTYTYMAAHSDQYGGKAGQTSTGEGLFRNNDNGTKTLVAKSPGVGLWEVAHLNRAMGGADGAVFAHKDLAGGENPPKGRGFPPDLKVTTFTDAKDFKEKLAAFQKETGQSAQIAVNAPFLRGGGKDGHGLHAMNAKLDKDGNVNFDNNWGARGDNNGKKMTDAEIMDATNPNKWNTKDGQGGPRPNDRSDFVPGTGSNKDQPGKLEDKDNKGKKEEEDRRRKDESDKDKDKDKAKKPEDEDQKKKNEAVQKILQKLAEQARLARAMSEWENRKQEATARGQKFNEPRPQESNV